MKLVEKQLILNENARYVKFDFHNRYISVFFLLLHLLFYIKYIFIWYHLFGSIY